MFVLPIWPLSDARHPPPSPSPTPPPLPTGQLSTLQPVYFGKTIFIVNTARVYSMLFIGTVYNMHVLDILIAWYGHSVSDPQYGRSPPESGSACWIPEGTAWYLTWWLKLWAKFIRCDKDFCKFCFKSFCLNFFLLAPGPDLDQDPYPNGRMRTWIRIRSTDICRYRYNLKLTWDMRLNYKLEGSVIL